MPKAHLQRSDLQGISRLAIEATTQITNISEGLFATIMRRPTRRIGGIPGLVYRQIHTITRLVGDSIEALLAAFGAAAKQTDSSRQRDDLLAALNGVLGDYLVASNNPLQTSMSLRIAGKVLEFDDMHTAIEQPQARILLYLHGVCMHDQQLKQHGHDHGLAAAAALGYSPIHGRYNTGLPIANNGQQLSELLEQLVANWPVPVAEIVIIGYSMGGLVARSACYYAQQLGHTWHQKLGKLIFLATPHHGSAVERYGAWLHYLLERNRYSALFGQIARLRSAGITDLRYGTIIDHEQPAVDRFAQPSQRPDRVALPAHVACYALAATRSAKKAAYSSLRGDGLVAVASALGQAAQQPDLDLQIPAERQAIVYRTHHFAILANQAAYQQLLAWLQPLESGMNAAKIATEN
ncbi:esterase/lipase family protein [Herpetosiphon llansteffanensis]|uniref:esterase/lipase family protein n=1 Tax=Herpetosiphon llansteffanensis TaxID=2094568 RepID=UPI000D7CA26C|nr:alpha/beta hydrolase [Herpetosiphon llansteffanensis]